LQNPVGFTEALAVFRPTGCKTAFFRGYSFKTEVLKEAQYSVYTSVPFLSTGRPWFKEIREALIYSRLNKSVLP
jgi:hypothetical protein